MSVASAPAKHLRREDGSNNRVTSRAALRAALHLFFGRSTIVITARYNSVHDDDREP